MGDDGRGYGKKRNVEWGRLEWRWGQVQHFKELGEVGNGHWKRRVGDMITVVAKGLRKISGGCVKGMMEAEHDTGKKIS